MVRSLEAALWAFYRSDSFRDGALRAVNLGNDADTTGAIYGQLAGAFYGVHAIPEDWIERLTMREFIRESADAFSTFRPLGPLRRLPRTRSLEDHLPLSHAAAAGVWLVLCAECTPLPSWQSVTTFAELNRRNTEPNAARRHIIR